jgi:enoyl-CoA hydratase
MADQHEPHVLIEREGHVVTVVMNRPAARNAMDAELLARLADAWTMIDADPEVRVAILTGAGGHFSAGSDLKAMAAGWGDGPFAARFKEDPDLHWKAFLRHYRLAKPLIAAVEGIAAGGGTEILEATDLRVAGRSARFGLTEARWGMFPLGGSTVRLARQIPRPLAMEMLLTGRLVGAEEALRFGLLNRVVDDGGARAAAMELANQIAANGPLAVQAIKRSVVECAELPEREALARELQIGQPVFATEDAKEGPRAFVEKRSPRFQGR